MMNQIPKSLIPIVVIVILVLSIGSRFYESIPAGHVAVATLFGSVKPEPYEAGLHIPVNPLYDWHLYDVRQKTHLEQARVPSQDQLQTKIDVSVQYRLIGKAAPRILKETGTAEDVVKVHIIPKLRSLIREQGKAVKRAEDFFLEESQITLQTALLEGLRDYLGLKGVEVGLCSFAILPYPPLSQRLLRQKRSASRRLRSRRQSWNVSVQSNNSW